VGSMGQGAARGSLVGGAGVLCYLELSSVCRFWQQPERWEGRSMGCTRPVPVPRAVPTNLQTQRAGGL
jgi:hypothetical protein